MMLADNIKKYRKENNLSQDDLAEKLDVSRQSISLWENGQTQPTLDNIVALANIFGISTDDLIGNTGIMQPSESRADDNKEKKKIRIIVLIAVIVVLAVVAVSVFGILQNGRSAATTTDESNSDSEVSDTEIKTAPTNTPAQSEEQPTANATSSTTTAKPDEQPTATTALPTAEPKFDLFNYCKGYISKKGKLNGDYYIYQQDAARYGGYDNEYFSMSYWSNSNMVEFCLHCPLSDTFSINFYLRMRGGYNGKYEYVCSRYYRDNGESLRELEGTIDPAVFSDNYPLKFDHYKGSVDGENEFIEECRIGMCDLIHCLKEFVSVEAMECYFSDFDFVNF